MSACISSIEAQHYAELTLKPKISPFAQAWEGGSSFAGTPRMLSAVGVESKAGGGQCMPTSASSSGHLGMIAQRVLLP